MILSLQFSFSSNFCLLCYEKRTKEHLTLSSARGTLTWGRWEGPWWAERGPAGGLRMCRCCWGRAAMGPAGMELGEPLSGVLGTGWQEGALGRTQAEPGGRSVSASFGWWGSEGATWERDQRFTTPTFSLHLKNTFCNLLMVF